MELDIYGSDGVLKVTVGVDDSSTQVKELMGDNVLSLGFVLYEHVALDVNDYVDFLGERYWLMERYVPAMRNSQEWVYSIRMFGLESLIKRFLVLNSVDGDADPVFTLTASPSDHVALIVDCINEGMGCDDWSVGTVDGEDNVVIDYEGKYCDEALRELADVLGTEFWFDGTTVNVCRCERGTAVSLSHGEGLVGLEREEASNVKLYTRLFPVGSSRNIDPERYGHSRLMLPDGRKYVDVNVERYGVIHHYEKDAFAGIYPRRVGRVSSVRWETAMNDDGSEYRIYFFKDSGLNFNPNDYELEGEVKRVSFQEGSDLAGLGEGDDHYFEVNWNNSTHEFEIITIWPYGDGTALPGGSLIPAVGDSYILWNIGMPDSYYEDAEEELLAAVEEYNAKHGVDSSVYKGRTDHTWMEAHEDVCLRLGQRVRLGHESFFEDGYRVSRITKMTRKVNLPGEVDLEVSDVVGTGTMQKLNDDIKGVRIYAKEVAEGAARVNIIGTGSSEGASDSSVFSSLRSVREFLSKTGNDAAHGVISFLKGLVARDDGDNPSVDAETIVAETINVGGDAFVDGNSHVGSSTVDGNQSVGGNQTVTGNQTVSGTSNVANENVDGNLNVGGTIETANLQVNGTAHFWEVVIDKISSVGGSAMFTPADGFKLDHFSDVGTTGKKLYWQGGNGSVNMWAVGDMALCYKNVSGNEIYWWAKVTAVGSETASGKTYHYIVVSTSDKDGTIELVEGADVVQCGHKKQTNETSAQAKARQGAVYIASSNSLDRGLVAPLIAKYEGINDYDLSLFRAGYQAQNGSKFVGDFEISSGGSTIPLDEYIGSHQPYIGTDKYWYVWDLATNQYKKSVLAEGAPGIPGGDGVTPHIGDNGNWWIGNLDTGVSAKGDPGAPGDDGTSVTIVSQSVTYGVNNSGTVKPTTWQANVPATSDGQYLWTRTIVTYSDGTTTTSYSVSYHGMNGNDGTTYYTWIKYADTASGGGLSDDPTGKEYIGFAYNKTTATESTNPSDYSWSLIRGEQGVPGEPGTDGTTYYTWIKYSDVLSPTSSSQIYDTPKSTTIAIGIAVNKTTATEGTNPSAYTWSRFKGEQGVPGNDGTTYYTWIKYADTASGGGLSDDPTGKEYIGFAYNKTTATESTNPSDYSWSLIRGEQGVPGEPGTDGTTYYTWIKYSDVLSPTLSSQIYDTPKSTTIAIGIAVNKTTATEGTNPSAYTWSRFKGEQGVPGNDGTTYYTWIKYADTASGGGLSDDPTGKEYIGFAYNKTTATESTNPSDYSWSLIRGEQGVPGEPGTDGTTYYTWIKYSDVLSPTSSSQIYDTPKSTTIAIGIAVNKTGATESTDPSQYTWSRFKGEQGVPGSDAVEFVVNPSHLEFDFSMDVARTIVKSATIECYKGGVKQDVRVIKVTDGQVNCTSSVAYDSTNYVNTVSLTVASSKVSVQSITGEDRYLAPTSGYAEVRANVGGVTYYIVIDFTVNQKTTYQQFLVDENQFKSTYESFKEDVNGTLTQQGTQISQNSAGITTLAQTQTQQGNTISQHTSQISQQSDRIDSVVSTQTQQGNTISQHSSRISQNAEQISLAVERQEEYGRQNLAFDPLYRGDIWVKDASTSEYVALEGTAITSYGLAPSMTIQENDYPPFPELDNLCYRIYAPSIPSTIPSSGATLYGRYADRNNRMELPSGKVVTVSVWVYNDREEALDSTQVVSALMVYTSKTGTSAYGSPIYNSMMPADSNWHNSAYLGGRYKNLGVVSTVTNGDRIWSQVAIVIDINSSSITRYIEHVPYVLIHRPSSPYRLNMYYSEWRVEEGDIPSHEVFSNNVERNLLQTGIDITRREIVVTSDNFKIQNNKGKETLTVDPKGNAIFGGAVNSQMTVLTSDDLEDTLVKLGDSTSTWDNFTNMPEKLQGVGSIYGIDLFRTSSCIMFDSSLNNKVGSLVFPFFYIYDDGNKPFIKIKTKGVSAKEELHLLTINEARAMAGKKVYIYNGGVQGSYGGMPVSLGYRMIKNIDGFVSWDQDLHPNNFSLPQNRMLAFECKIGASRANSSSTVYECLYWEVVAVDDNSTAYTMLKDSDFND